MKKLFEVIKWSYLVLIIAVIFACSGGESDSGGVSGSGGESDSEAKFESNGNGTLSIYLTDASTADYKAVYITVKEVQVHAGNEADNAKEGNWKVVATPNATYNLLKLVNGFIEQLGVRDLTAGHYTQLRMIIGNTADNKTNINDEPHPFANYIVDQSGAYKEVKIPSGYQTGIKIVHGFDIAEDQLTELVLDFDVLKSIIKAGNSGKWILKPTIKVIDRVVSGSISGIISDADAKPLEGVLVSAQVYNPNAADIKDQITGHGQGISEQDGYYFMYLWPGTYKVVVYQEGHAITCRNIQIQSSDSLDQNFTVETIETGTINGEVTIEDAGEDQTALLSFRTIISCEGSAEEPVEIVSKSIAGGGSYSVQLPPGTYSLVASTEGRTTQKYDSITVTSSNITVQNVMFEVP